MDELVENCGNPVIIMTTLDKVLISLAVFILLFTITMIVLFCVFQAIPDTLVNAVFGVVSSETVLTFLIWYLKRKGQKNEKRHTEKTNK